MERQSLQSPGDVAVCGNFTEPGPIQHRPGPERICFVASLASRAELEALLRALLLRPEVRHLVLCGDELEPAGEALLALWREGLDEHGRLPGPRGVLSAELDAASLDTLRGSIRLLDRRGRPLADIAQAIPELPMLPSVREPQALHAPAPRERKIFSSRATTFPIFSSSVGDAWLQLLNLVLRIGTEKESAGARVAEALNAVVTIDPASTEEDFPDFFDFTREDFERHFSRFEAQDAPAAIAGATMTFGAEGARGRAPAPGLLSATFNVLDGKLLGSFVLDRADIYTDWPLEAMALMRFQHRAAERAGLAAGASVFVVHSGYLDDRDWERAWGLLAEFFKRPLPLQVDPAGIFLFGNDGGQARAMLLDHDASTIFWEEAFSDPEDLSWYIVDVMPWLLPQHIRYVGQECAALMRAIRTGECYVQG